MSNDTFYSRFIKGISAFFVGQIFYFLLRILLPPLFLRAWGVNIYGEWLVLTSLVTYLSLVDLGSQLYIVNRLTQAHAQNDIGLFRSLLHTGMTLFFILPLVVFLIFSTIITLSPIQQWLHLHVISSTMAQGVLIALAFQFVFSLPQGLLTGVYRAIGKLPRGVMLCNIITLGQLVFTALALWLHASLFIVALVQTLPFLLVAFVAALDLNIHHPEFHLFSLKYARLNLLKEFIFPSLNFLAIQLSQAFSIQGIVIIVGIALGSLQVVMFSTMRTIVYLIRQILSLVSNTAWPELTRLDAQRRNTDLYTLYTFILRTTMVASATIVILLHYSVSYLYRLWLHDKVPFDQFLMDLFFLYGIQQMLYLCCANFLMSVNHHKALAKVYLFTSLISVIAAYVGGHYYGLTGVLVFLLITDLVLPFWLIPLLVSRYCSLFNFYFFTKEFLIPVAALLVGIYSIWLSPIALVALLLFWKKSLPSKNILNS